MDLSLKTILNHKVIAVVNLLWAIFHVWIAIMIEQDYFFLAIVIILILIFIGTYKIGEKIARYVFFVISLLYLVPLFEGVIPTLISSEFDGWYLASVTWLLIFVWTLLAGTAQWTGIGKSKNNFQRKYQIVILMIFTSS